MQKQKSVLPVFLVSLVLVIIVMIFGIFGWFGWLQKGSSWVIFSSSQLFSAPLAHFSQDNSTLDKLKKENMQLRLELAHQQVVMDDNKALRDQFQTNTPASQNLVPAPVVGRPEVIPNISFPESLVIGVGQEKMVKKGMAVISQNMIVGKIDETSGTYALVSLVTSKQSSFAGKDSNSGAIGVVKGQGNGDITFENVLLSEQLHVGDMIVSSGNQDISGLGYPPDIVVGKITGVEKNPSALYQRARVATLLPLDTISTVFVIVH